MVKKAVLIGINYTNTTNALNGCINDITNINNFLVNNCEYSQNNVKILTDKSTVLPSKNNIIENIKWLVSNNLKGDTLFFYFSGHGSNSLDKNKDESDGKDEDIIPLDFTTSGTISDDWLYQQLASNVSENINLWCFFDSCHSGTVLDLMYNYKSYCTYKGKVPLDKNSKYNPLEWTDRFLFSQEKSRTLTGNICQFSGCLDPEFSADAKLENTYQGAFTYCFLKFLNNNLIKVGDKTIFSGSNIKLKDVLKEINALLDIYKFAQNSQLSVGKFGDIERFFEI
jgi:hypothetical protein